MTLLIHVYASDYCFRRVISQSLGRKQDTYLHAESRITTAWNERNSDQIRKKGIWEKAAGLGSSRTTRIPPKVFASLLYARRKAHDPGE